MAYYWRKVRRLEYWTEPYRGPCLRANCLSDMGTRGDEDSLSLWLIDDQTLPLVVAQLAKGWRSPQDIVYLKIPTECVSQLNVPLQQSDEHSPPQPLQGKHYNVQVGTAEKLVAFSKAAATKSECDCMRKSQVRSSIQAAISAGHCSADDFPDDLRAFIT